MRLGFALLALAIAAPATAQRDLVLPAAPARIDYVETVCVGGIAGQREQVRVYANGRIEKASRRGDGILRAHANGAAVAKVWRELDRARFEQRVVPPEKPYIMDGIDCSLTRRANGRLHTVNLMQQQRGKPAYRDLSQAVDDINALGQRATGPILRPAASR